LTLGRRERIESREALPSLLNGDARTGMTTGEPDSLTAEDPMRDATGLLDTCEGRATPPFPWKGPDGVAASGEASDAASDTASDAASDAAPVGTCLENLGDGFQSALSVSGAVRARSDGCSALSRERRLSVLRSGIAIDGEADCDRASAGGDSPTLPL
jgi:hypothetical protein